LAESDLSPSFGEYEVVSRAVEQLKLGAFKLLFGFRQATKGNEEIG
jgi:hypothetical protein